MTSETDSARGPAHHGPTAPKAPEVNEAGLEIIKVVVHLPGLSSAAEASLEVRRVRAKGRRGKTRFQMRVAFRSRRLNSRSPA